MSGPKAGTGHLPDLEPAEFLTRPRCVSHENGRGQATLPNLEPAEFFKDPRCVSRRELQIVFYFPSIILIESRAAWAR